MYKICTKCGKEMEVIQTGFEFIMNERIYNSDLFGCNACKHFQIFGIDRTSEEVSKVSPCEFVKDPTNNFFQAILNPVITFFPDFNAYMKKWYPHWNWKGDGTDV